MADATGPRVPHAALMSLPGVESVLQVNHCKMPDCDNFGVPAMVERPKSHRKADQDPHYTLKGSGGIPCLVCRSCDSNFPIKSNGGMVDEVDRLAEESGVWTPEEATCCRNEDCVNHDRPIALHRREYRKRGKTKNGKGQYYECKQCSSITLISDPVRLHENRRYAVGLLSRIANKTPVNGCIRGLGLKSGQAYYQVLDFLVRRCRKYSGGVDRALMDGRLTLPKDLSVECDAQSYTMNWISRMDRRNVELHAYCTVDSASGFILGLHANFDGRVDPFEINAESLERGDAEKKEAFRKYPQYWLAGDEISAGRVMGRRDRAARVEIMTRIEALYENAEFREDVENIELQGLNTDYVTPFLGNGLQIHMPYVAYAHWMIMHRILTGAGVDHVQFNSDIDSMNRAAFLSAFTEEVKRGDAHAFFVNYTKYETIDERRKILKEKMARIRAFRDADPERAALSKRQLAREMMKETIEERVAHGQWDDEWVVHPLPTINEPHKALSWMTPDAGLDTDRVADIFLRASLARVDNVFMKSRRLFNALERPIGTSSSHNKVWHGYAPYNPLMLQKYLTLFRAVHNFVFVGTSDDRTPAMRLGFAKAPLSFEDLIWPGERVPRPKRARRRGRKAIAA